MQFLLSAYVCVLINVHILRHASLNMHTSSGYRYIIILLQVFDANMNLINVVQ